MSKHIQKLEEADYALASLSDAEIMNPSSVSLKNVAKRSKEEADKAAEAEVKKAKRAEMRSKSRYKQINENTLPPRNSDIILAALDSGIVKAETLLLQILKWIPEDDLDGFVEFYGYNDVDE